MADSTLDSEKIILCATQWWAGANIELDAPEDGLLGPKHFNVVTPYYTPGTIKRLYQNGTYGLAGWCDFIYLKLVTEDAANVLAAKQFVTLDDSLDPFGVTNNAGGDLPNTGRTGIALGDVTVGRYAFYQCNGPIAEQLVYPAGQHNALATAANRVLNGNYVTDGTIVAAGPCVLGDLATPGATGELGLSAAVDTDTDAGSTAYVKPVIALALSADAAN